MEELILYLALKYEGDFKKIYEALLKKEQVDEELKNELKKNLKANYTTIFSNDYPEALKSINCPPFVLFYYGNLDLLNKKTIGVVGTHKVNNYGYQATQKFVKQLVEEEYVIISGMEQGVDTIAHQTAITHCGKTIAILGTGIDYCYPHENENLYTELKMKHLVMSEYPFMVNPNQRLFPFRNRIISGLSSSLLVTQAQLKSEVMITASYALEQGKEIYCVPERYDDYGGCNELIKNGAMLITNVKDITDE